MFIHRKEPLHTVEVKKADPAFAQKLLEQFGGATGELTACLQYFVQSFHTEDPALKDMLLDISTEEIGHLEMAGMLIEQHTRKASAKAQDAAYKSTLFSLRGHGPHFLDSQGVAWKADYINEGGQPRPRPQGKYRRRGGCLGRPTKRCWPCRRTRVPRKR